MLLIVVEDRQAGAALRTAIASARARDEPFVVLTADALLVMRLRRDGIGARLPLDAFANGSAPAGVQDRGRLALDSAAATAGEYATFDGTDFVPYLEYTLIPTFVRAVRNVTAVADAASALGANRLLLIGGGELVHAARLVAVHRAIPFGRAEGGIITRALHAIARLRAGRATRWVNTEFRALVLEPGFLALLQIKALWRRVAAPAPAVHADAIVVVGDRFTADVVERLRGDARQVILAGAAQPGRALFDDGSAPHVPIEAFMSAGDVLRAFAATMDAVARAAAL